MSIIDQLSSSQKQRSEHGNRYVTTMILNHPDLIQEIISCMDNKNDSLVGDCVEVCVMVAETNPEMISPYSDLFIPLIKRRNTRVRWEAMHAIALITPLVPDAIAEEWNHLADLFFNEKSVIVRDNIVICAGNLAASGTKYAEKVYQFLIDALIAYQTHHAKLALEGILKGITHLRIHRYEIRELTEIFVNHPKPSIKKVALQLKKQLSGID